MKILVVSLYFDPDHCQANGPIVRAICNDLADAGHDVTVITSFPHYNNDGVWPEYRRKFFQRDRVGNLDVIRSYIYVPRKRTLFHRILNYVSFNITSTLSGLFTGRQDAIFVISPPLTIGLTAYALGIIKQIPYCYNLQDIWPEAAVRLGLLRNRRVISFFERLEKFIYKRSEKVFVISEEFKENLISKGIEDTKIEVIPNFVDTSFIKPLERNNQFSADNGLSDRFVVLYAGNTGLLQGLEVIPDAAEILQAYDDILFLIVGQGITRERLIESVQERQIGNVRFLPLQPESHVPWLYASCDTALIPLKRGMTKNSLPCKTYSIMASGRPYIASVDKGSHVWKLTDTVGCGICVEPENGKALAEAVLRLKSDQFVRESMGRQGRQYVESHFSREAGTKRYRQSLESLVDIRVDTVAGRATLTDKRMKQTSFEYPSVE